MKTISMWESGEVPICELTDGSNVVTIRNAGPKTITITMPPCDTLMAIQVGNVVYPNPYYKRPGDRTP